jgi:hypothetical protein
MITKPCCFAEFEREKGTYPFGISPSILRKMVLGVSIDLGIFSAL